MTDWVNLTQEQHEKRSIVRVELVEAMNRLAADGIEPQLIIAGAGLAISDVIASVFEIGAVPVWFRGQAEFTDRLIKQKG